MGSNLTGVGASDPTDPFDKDLAAYNSAMNQLEEDASAQQNIIATMMAALKSGHVEQAFMMTQQVLLATQQYDNDDTGVFACKENLLSDLTTKLASAEGLLAKMQSDAAKGAPGASWSDAKNFLADLQNIWSHLTTKDASGNTVAQGWIGSDTTFYSNVTGALSNIASALGVTVGSASDQDASHVASTINWWVTQDTSKANNDPAYNNLVTQLQGIGQANNSAGQNTNSEIQAEMNNANSLASMDEQIMKSLQTLFSSVNSALSKASS